MIPFLDLKRINLQYEKEFNEAMRQVLHSGWFILGDKVREFENHFAEYCGVKHCIGVANGLDALTIILEGYKDLKLFQGGDEVLVPSNTFIASILAISKAGLVPVLVEPQLGDYLIDPAVIETKITAKTVAIMPVHLYGQVCDMTKINTLAKRHNLKVIEDSAQAHGAIFNGQRTGNLGDVSAFSFYPGKNLGALGDGGCITTNDDLLANVVRTYSNYGSLHKYNHEIKGTNSRLDELQAAFLSIKLNHLDRDNSRRREIAEFYMENIKNPLITLPVVHEKEGHVWHLFVIRTKNRSELQKYLAESGIQTLIHYPIAPHKQQAYAEMNNKSYPKAEKIHQEVLSIPISPVLAQGDVVKICDAINKYCY